MPGSEGPAGLTGYASSQGWGKALLSTKEKDLQKRLREIERKLKEAMKQIKELFEIVRK